MGTQSQFSRGRFRIKKSLFVIDSIDRECRDIWKQKGFSLVTAKLKLIRSSLSSRLNQLEMQLIKIWRAANRSTELVITIGLSRVSSRNLQGLKIRGTFQFPCLCQEHSMFIFTGAFSNLFFLYVLQQKITFYVL